MLSTRSLRCSIKTVDENVCEKDSPVKRNSNRNIQKEDRVFLSITFNRNTIYDVQAEVAAIRHYFKEVESRWTEF